MDSVTRIASMVCTLFLAMFITCCVLFFIGTAVFAKEGFIGYVGYAALPDYMKGLILGHLFLAAILLYIAAGLFSANRRSSEA